MTSSKGDFDRVLAKWEGLLTNENHASDSYSNSRTMESSNHHHHVQGARNNIRNNSNNGDNDVLYHNMDGHTDNMMMNSNVGVRNNDMNGVLGNHLGRNVIGTNLSWAGLNESDNSVLTSVQNVTDVLTTNNIGINHNMLNDVINGQEEGLQRGSTGGIPGGLINNNDSRINQVIASTYNQATSSSIVNNSSNVMSNNVNNTNVVDSLSVNGHKSELIDLSRPPLIAFAANTENNNNDSTITSKTVK